MSVKVTILDFYTPDCQPCKRIPPLLMEVARERRNVAINTINANEHPQLVASYGVQTVPTVVLKTANATEVVAGWQLTKQHLLSVVDRLQKNA